MRIDLINCIFDLLQKNNVVALPGLGSLRIDRNFAKISKNKIHPPSREIKFSAQIEELEQFIAYLKLTYGISTDNAERVLKRFSQRMINQLVNYNEVLLPRIGVLKSNGNKPLKFVKDEAAFDFTHNYLPVLKLQRLIRPKTQAAPLGTTTAITTSAVVKAQELELPIAPKSLKVETPTTSKSIDELPILESKVVSPIIEQKALLTDTNLALGTVVLSEQELAKSSEPLKTAVAAISNDATVSGFNWKPVIFSVLAVLFALFCFKTCKNKDVVVAGDNIETNEDTNLDNDTAASGVYNPDKVYDGSELHLIPKSQIEKGCIIIVGSFRQEANASNMLETLENNGYETYHELNEEGLKRVGLLFDCVDQDLVDFIQKVRKDVEEKAWFLQPMLHIDYES